MHLLLCAYANRTEGVAWLWMNSWIESTKRVEARKKGRGRGGEEEGAGGGWRGWQRRDERAGCKALKLPRFIVGTDWSVPRSIRGSFH